MESDLAGIAIYNIKAKDLHDTGSKLDPQDPSVLIRIGGNEKRTDRQMDAKTNASFSEHMHFQLNSTRADIEALNICVEVWNISDPKARFNTKRILVGQGSISLIHVLTGGNRVFRVDLNYKNQSGQQIEKGVVEFEVAIKRKDPSPRLFSQSAYSIQISNISVKDLPPADIGGTSDPYVVFTMPIINNGNETVVRETAPKLKVKGVAEWKDNFTVFTLRRDSLIQIKIYDYNDYKEHELMCFVSLQLSDIQDGRSNVENLKTENVGRFAGRKCALLSLSLQIERVDPIEAYRKNIISDFDTALLEIAREPLINELYAAHLDVLLIKPSEKELLLTKVSIEDKKAALVESKRKKFDEWGVSENNLLKQIKNPLQNEVDFCDLVQLTKILSTANRHILNSFFGEEGLLILLSILQTKTNIENLRELDYGLILQTLRCLKAVMNTSIGMEGFLSVKDLVKNVVKCLYFEYKPIALMAIEILTLCCYFSATSNHLVAQCLLAKPDGAESSPVFTALCDGLRDGDIEVKTAVLKLVNGMIYKAAAFKQFKLHNEVRAELLKQRFEVVLKKSKGVIESESSQIDEILNYNGTSTDDSFGDANKLDSLSILTGNAKKATPNRRRKSGYLPRTLTNNSMESLMTSPGQICEYVDEDSGSESSLPSQTNYPKPENDPKEGIMSGILYIFGRKKHIFGAKKLKRRLFELSDRGVKVFNGKEKLKATWAYDSITDLEPFATNDLFQDVNEVKAHFSFKLHLNEKVVSIGFGCETVDDRDNWLQAIRENFYKILLKKARDSGAFNIYAENMKVSRLEEYITKFTKQYHNYSSMMFGYREDFVERSGINLDNINDVSKYLVKEAIAAGNETNLKNILCQLLLIPVESEGLWAAIPVGLQKLLEICKRNAIPDGGVFSGSEDERAVKAALDSDGVKEELLKKAEEGGEAYGHMHDLALFAVRGEKDSERMLKRIADLEEEVKKLEALQNVPAEESFLRPLTKLGNEDEATKSEPDRYAPFRMLQKFHTPALAIEQKMRQKGFTPDEIKAFFEGRTLKKENEDLDPAAQERSDRLDRLEKKLNEARLLPRASAGDLLSVFQKRITTYEKAFRRTKDLNVIRKLMQEDNCSKEEETELVKLVAQTVKSTADVPSSNNFGMQNDTVLDMEVPEGMEPKQKIIPKVKLQTLFWTKISAADIPGTIWHKLRDYDLPESICSRICDWFYAFSPPTKIVRENRTERKQDLISLLPSEKNRTIMIVLKKLKLQHEERFRAVFKQRQVADNASQVENDTDSRVGTLEFCELLQFFVIEMDPSNLDKDVTDSLRGILPIPEELEKVKAYNDPSVLDLTGQFMWYFYRVPEVGKRLHLHAAYFTWPAMASAVEDQMNLLLGACESLKSLNSELQQLLAIILAYGNYINGGTKHGQSYGIKLLSLQKLSEFKTKDKVRNGFLPLSDPLRGSLLDFLAQHLGLDEPSLLDLDDKLAHLSHAARVPLSQIKDDLDAMEKVIRIALEENAKLVNGSEFMEQKFAVPLRARLEAFIRIYEPRMTSMVALFSTTEKALKNLSVYFGTVPQTEAQGPKSSEEEDDPKNPDRKEPHQKVFGYLSDFVRAMKKVHHDAEQFREAERKTKAAKEEMEKLRETIRLKRTMVSNLSDETEDMTDELEGEGPETVDLRSLPSLQLPLVQEIHSEMETATPIRGPMVVTDNLFAHISDLDEIAAEALGDDYINLLHESQND